MVQIKAFDALRPPPAYAPRVSSPPYDVISSEEARALAEGNPLSFLHVIRPEINLPVGTSLYDDAVYDSAAEGLSRLSKEGALVRDAEPGIYLYRQAWKGRIQTGIVCCCHVDDYRQDAIRKHETTRKDKEDDRTRHLLAIDAHAGPVFLTFKKDHSIAARIAEDSSHRPDYHFVSPDGVTHTAWRVSNPDRYVSLLAEVENLYVADGHHRSASAERAASLKEGTNPNHTGHEEYNWFLSVLFPADDLTILAYNRVVADLNGMTSSEFLDALREVGELAPANEANPDQACSFGVYVDGSWWSLTIDQATINWEDPIESLDVSILQERVLNPLLGIEDPRTDKRIGFIGGIRGTNALEERVDTEVAAVAFALYPTSIDQLLQVADTGGCMPPKSTWFEPKLRSGLFIHSMESVNAPASQEATSS